MYRRRAYIRSITLPLSVTCISKVQNWSMSYYIYSKVFWIITTTTTINSFSYRLGNQSKSTSIFIHPMLLVFSCVVSKVFIKFREKLDLSCKTDILLGFTFVSVNTQVFGSFNLSSLYVVLAECSWFPLCPRSWATKDGRICYRHCHFFSSIRQGEKRVNQIKGKETNERYLLRSLTETII